jgi:proteasome lid subunit RPN8/RPN11
VIVQVRRRVLEAVGDHARAEAPNECCGLLVGSQGLIDESVATRNIVASVTRYEVDPREHIALVRRLRGTDREVVGTYHSHPASPATPSPTDIAQAFYPEFVYLIISLVRPQDPDIRVYRIRSGNVETVELVPVP